MKRNERVTLTKKHPVYLGYNFEQLHHLGAEFTAKEIAGQPELWLKIWQQLIDERKALIDFLSKILVIENLEIILTGAGTSAFVGEVLQGSLRNRLKANVRAAATTDIVTHPENYFCLRKPVLMISFARSGNSPESLAVFNLANHFCENIFHLIITCNQNGIMAKLQKSGSMYVFVLPDEANDQSLAMTGSFTGMLLSALLLANLQQLEETEKKIIKLADYGKKIIEKYNSQIRKIAQLPFRRAVFLGSGPMQGIARESQLKVQELTDGRVICKYDSFLGFRHGPKAVIDETTLLVYLLSNISYVSQYEYDLIDAVKKGNSGIARIGIGEDLASTEAFDYVIDLKSEGRNLDTDFLAIASVLPAQILGFHKSINLKLHPDQPSESGAITRVVQGVKIYNYSETKLCE